MPHLLYKTSSQGGSLSGGFIGHGYTFVMIGMASTRDRPDEALISNAFAYKLANMSDQESSNMQCVARQLPGASSAFQQLQMTHLRKL